MCECGSRQRLRRRRLCDAGGENGDIVSLFLLHSLAVIIALFLRGQFLFQIRGVKTRWLVYDRLRHLAG